MFRVHKQWHLLINKLMKISQRKILYLIWLIQVLNLPEWSLFSELIFCKIKNVKANEDRGGSFFQYLINDNYPKEIVNK